MQLPQTEPHTAEPCTASPHHVILLAVQVIEEQHTFLDRQVSLLRCSLEPLNDDDKVRPPGCTGGPGAGGVHKLMVLVHNR